jgi:hypothetical protein
LIRNEALITSETFKANLTGFENLSGLVSGIINTSSLSILFYSIVFELSNIPIEVQINHFTHHFFQVLETWKKFGSYFSEPL